MKKLLLMIVLLTSTLLAETNPLSDYIANEDYSEGMKKFSAEKNIFKESVVDRQAIVKEVQDAEARVRGVFTSVLATVYQDKKWGAVIYYNNPKVSSQQRLVITGDTALRVSGYLYYLIPYEKGLRVKDLRTGNYYNLEIKGR